MQKGFAALPILLAILLIGGLIAYYFYSHQQVSPVTSFKKSIEQVNIKTYSNKELDFEFKYSKDLKVQQDSEEEFNKRGNGDFRKNFKNYVTYEPGEFLGAVVVLDKSSSYDTNPLTIWIFNNINNLTIEQWYEKYWYYPFVWGDYTSRRNSVAPIIESTISGQLAKYGVVNYQPDSPKFIYLSKNNKMYLFRIIGQTGEQILSTIKVL